MAYPPLPAPRAELCIRLPTTDRHTASPFHKITSFRFFLASFLVSPSSSPRSGIPIVRRRSFSSLSSSAVMGLLPKQQQPPLRFGLGSSSRGLPSRSPTSASTEEAGEAGAFGSVSAGSPNRGLTIPVSSSSLRAFACVFLFCSPRFALGCAVGRAVFF